MDFQNTWNAVSHFKIENRKISTVLGFAALGFIVMLLLGRMFTVMELRSLERDYRQNQSRFSYLEEDLDTSCRKYLVALKSEGVGSIR